MALGPAKRDCVFHAAGVPGPGGGCRMAGNSGDAPDRRAVLRTIATGAALAMPRSAGGKPPSRAVSYRIRVDASAKADGPPDVLSPRRFDMVGVFDADWLTDARYARLLDMMAALL